MSVTNHNVSHHPSEVSEEKQRRKKRSKDRKNQVPGHVDLLTPSLLANQQHQLRIRQKTSQRAKKGKKRTQFWDRKFVK